MRLAPASVILLLAGLAANPVAQAPTPETGEVAFRQACLDATTDALVLNVAAHPDDEAASTITVLRHQHGVRTVTLYSTCGEGGQNAIGREIGPALAAIRVRETLRAASYTGTQVEWLGFADFGYSKTREETARFWGEELLLERMARALYRVQPDVVLTNHSTTGGHGHHRATAWALEELCPTAAPDGTEIPLYRRSRSRDDAPTFDPGVLDAVRGRTHAQQAHEGWTQHRSQGPWRDHDPTRVRKNYWVQVVPQPPLLPNPEGADDNGDADDEADNAPDRAAGEHPLERLGSMFDEPEVKKALDEDLFYRLQSEFLEFREDLTRARHVDRAERLLPLMRDLAKTLRESGARRALARVERRIDALERIVLHGSGITLIVHARKDAVVDGEEIVLDVRMQGPIGLNVSSITCDGVQARPRTDENGAPIVDSPWLELPVKVRRTGVDGDGSEPEVVSALTSSRRFVVEARCTWHGLPLRARRQIEIGVKPKLELEFAEPVRFVPMVMGPGAAGSTVAIPFLRPGGLSMPLEVRWAGTEALPLELSWRHASAVQPRVDVAGDAAMSVEPGRATRFPVAFEVEATDPDAWPNLGYGVTVSNRSAATAGVASSTRIVPFDIGPFAGAWADARFAGRSIGLVRGPDDTVEKTLSALTDRLVILGEQELAAGRIADCATVILDIRAYHHRPELARYAGALQRFVEAGGRVLCCYHKPGEWNARDGKPLLAPYALEVGSRRVSEEDAAMKVLQPDHPIWTYPYAIEAENFDEWVQERGLNFPSKWADEWVPLIEAHDRGEKPLRGGLLYARYGDGDFVYCSLSLYRQLRNGHAGALELLFNLVTPAPR